MTKVTKKIRIDLANQGGLDFLSTIHAVQGDAYSRLVAFELYNGGEKYTPPEGTTAIVRYRKEDGTRGNYDVLPDGSSAYTINGNMLTVALAPQLCIVPGLVQLAVGLISGNAEINTFSVRVVVQPNPGITYQSEGHLKLAGTVADSGWDPNMYLGTDADGNVTALGTDKTLTQPGRAADAKATRDAVGELKEDLDNLINAYNLIDRKYTSHVWSQGEAGETEKYKISQSPIEVDRDYVDFYIDKSYSTPFVLFIMRELNENYEVIESHTMKLSEYPNGYYGYWLLNSSCKFLRFVFSTNNASDNITPNDVYERCPNLYIGYTPVKNIEQFNHAKLGFSIYDMYELNKNINSVSIDSTQLRDGSIPNGINADCVSTPVIFTKAKSIAVHTNRPNTEGYVYVYGFGTSSAYLADLNGHYDRVKNYVDYEAQTDNTYNLWGSDDRFGVQICMSEYNPSTNTYNSLRVQDFKNYKITVYDTSYLQFEDIYEETDNLFDSNKKLWVQGTVGSTRPYSCITSKSFIPEDKELYLCAEFLENCPESVKDGGIVVRIYDSTNNNIGSQWMYPKSQKYTSINILNSYPDASYFKIEVHSNRASAYIRPEYIESYINAYVGYNEITNKDYIYSKYAPINSVVDSKQNQRLDSIENYFKPYPDVYADYLNRRISTIIDKDLLIGNSGDSFIFITDMHDQNNYYSPLLAKEICRMTSVNSIVYGGDYINEPSSKSIATDYLTSRKSKCLVNDDVVFLRGNHDTNPYGVGQLTDSDFYGIFNKHIEKYINTNKKLYFYSDNASQKIRYFYLDSGVNGTIDSDQANWLSDKTTELNSEWTIIIFIHHGIYTDDKDDRVNIKSYPSLTTVKNSLVSITAKVACIICGHTHIDLADISGNYPIISTTCDAHGVQSSSMSSDIRTVNTINEQAFDVFHIDTGNKKIYVTRIGGGQYDVTNGDDLTLNDREFNYE